jgi:hypothetical protein
VGLGHVVVAALGDVIVGVVTEDLHAGVVGVVPDVVGRQSVLSAEIMVDAEGVIVLCGGPAEDGCAVVVDAVDRRGDDRGVLEKCNRLRSK